LRGSSRFSNLLELFRELFVFVIVIFGGVMIVMLPSFYFITYWNRGAGFVFFAIVASILVIFLILLGYRVAWTGFSEVVRTPTGGREVRSRKLLWDWLLLLSSLAVPIVIAAAGFWFTTNQNAQQQRLEDKRAAEAQKLADQRAQVDREIEEQRAQDESLQAYLDQMSLLLLEDDLLGTEEGSPVRTLAQARTTTIISRLDAEDNLSVTRFLTDSGLTGARRASPEQPSTVSLLKQTDLGYAELASAYLPDANLEQTKLQGVNLSNASLATADLSGADLQDADLEGADLYFADLSNADLRRANLKGTNLETANLGGADLEGADLPSHSPKFLDKLIDLIKQGRALDSANLEGADLEGKDLTGASLEEAILAKANLSDVKLNGADLQGATLTSANLSGANLEEANLSGANLEGADLEETTLAETNLREANVTQKQLEQAGSLEGATMPDGQLYEPPVKNKARGGDEENSSAS
jgi:uncharacterized protein YjbI with pentapeptide repeats